MRCPLRCCLFNFSPRSKSAGKNASTTNVFCGKAAGCGNKNFNLYSAFSFDAIDAAEIHLQNVAAALENAAKEQEVRFIVTYGLYI
jgi:hypothetical protein